MLSTRETILLGLADGVLLAQEEDLPEALEVLGHYVAYVRRDEGLDQMPPGWNRPAPASKGELVRVLQNACAHVADDDSWEGIIQWMLPDDDVPGLEGAEFGVIARYRIGNRDGQGGLRVFSPDA